MKGELAFANRELIPFDIERVFYLYDIPEGESRGGHAHIDQHQFLICPIGTYDVLVDDGVRTNTFTLNRQNIGLHIPPGIWATELNFAPGSICLVFSSGVYLEVDYIRDYSAFKEYKK